MYIFSSGFATSQISFPDGKVVVHLDRPLGRPWVHPIFAARVHCCCATLLIYTILPTFIPLGSFDLFILLSLLTAGPWVGKMWEILLLLAT